MTNFAFIMDLLKISSKKFSEIGFDKSQVSRWRRGKLRLMPNRHIVKSISALFWAADAARPHPVLQEILDIWYPASPCRTAEEKHALLERFLTEKGQLEEAYLQRREKRLGICSCADGDSCMIVSRGIEAVKQRILDFYDLILALPNPATILLVFPQGRGALSFDADFNACVQEKYDRLFARGHRICSVICTDDAIGHFTASYNRTLVHLLKGYARSQYFDDFNAETTELFLAAAGDSLALELREEEPGRIESAAGTIYTDESQISRIREQIRLYAGRSKNREYFDFFHKPDGYLKNVHISPDSPCYMIARLPHFGILPADAFPVSFALTDAEAELTSQELRPLLLHPPYFWEYATVRHIFCESAIENALLKKRHQCNELSAVLKRRVWMTTPHLIRQLAGMLTLLKERKNYEVCFLSEERFEALKIQLAVWGYGASIVWLDDAHSAASRGYVNQRIIQGFCRAAWDKIPGKMKARAASVQKLEQWLEKARRYGYDIENM